MRCGTGPRPGGLLNWQPGRQILRRAQRKRIRHPGLNVAAGMSGEQAHGQPGTSRERQRSPGRRGHTPELLRPQDSTLISYRAMLGVPAEVPHYLTGALGRPPGIATVRSCFFEPPSAGEETATGGFRLPDRPLWSGVRPRWRPGRYCPLSRASCQRTTGGTCTALHISALTSCAAARRCPASCYG